MHISLFHNFPELPNRLIFDSVGSLVDGGMEVNTHHYLDHPGLEYTRTGRVTSCWPNLVSSYCYTDLVLESEQNCVQRFDLINAPVQSKKEGTQQQQLMCIGTEVTEVTQNQAHNGSIAMHTENIKRLLG